ncbi:MAG: aminoacyl-tRNA hydrolase [Lachnospiraceae bacterium]
MKLIVGLGNPGMQYETTRHNVGFMTIDKISEAFLIPVGTKKHKALVGKGMIGSETVILAKPQTFMNNSGESVRAITDFYHINPEDVIVIFDDISLDVGQLRIRAKGSAGGHNGVKSIISHLGTEAFPRVKVGVGAKPPWQDLAAYVLGRFPKEEMAVMDEATNRACEAVYAMLHDGMQAAMNEYNKK